MSEIRYAALTAAGGRQILEGVVMRYGALAALPDGRQERFLPGAFGPDVSARDLILNVQHERVFPIARTAGGGLILTDSASLLSMRADLSSSTAGREAYELVRARILRGLSVEFTAIEERMTDGNVREIMRASLDNLGLVDKPAYDTSTVEARRQAEVRQRRIPKIGTLRGNVPAGKVLDCRCAPGTCTSAIFEPDSMDRTRAKTVALAEVDKAQDRVDEALDRADAARARWEAEDKKLAARIAAQDKADRERIARQEAAERAETRRIRAEEKARQDQERTRRETQDRIDRARLAEQKAEEEARVARARKRLEAERKAEKARLAAQRAEDDARRERERARLEAERQAEKERQAAIKAREEYINARLLAAERKRAKEAAERARREAEREAERFRKQEAQERARYQEAQERAERAAAAEDRDLLAVQGEYSSPVAAQSRGTLRTMPDDDGGLDFEIDLFDTPRGRSVLESMQAAPLYGRPYVDLSASVYTMNGGIATYASAVVSAIIIGPSDANQGWEPLREAGAEGQRIIIPAHVERRAHRRHVWL